MAEISILQSKLLVPRLHDDSIERSRLIEHLQNAHANVWLLSAAAGYGKTTLAVQALQSMETRLCWLSIDKADNDPVRFWAHLAATVLGTGPDYQSVADRLGPNSLNLAADAVMSGIEHEADSVTLVLDDLHEITNSETLAILGRLVSRPPQNLRIVMTTRTDPELPIGRLRIHGDLVEVRATDLAFNAKEAATLVDSSSDKLTQSLLNQTEGWATGLRMLAVANKTDSDSMPSAVKGETVTRDLGDFLAAEALQALRPELQTFLVHTSIVDIIPAELADQMMDRVDSLAVLRELERCQVFTTMVDPAEALYRYHALFRDFLRRQAEELEPATFSALHQLAADWYYERNDPDSSIRHSVAAKNYQQATESIRDHYSPFAQTGHLMMVHQWLESLGRDRCRQDPELRSAAAWVALNVRRYDEIDAWLDAPAGTEVAADRLHSLCIQSHRARHLGDVEQAIGFATQAINYVTGTPDVHDDHSVAYAALELAAQTIDDHDEGRTSRAISQGLSLANDSSALIGFGGAALRLSAGPKPTTDDLAAADALADRALSYCSSPRLEWFHQPLAALLTKSRIAHQRGRLAEAQDFAERCAKVAEFGLEPLMLVRVQCQLARIHHDQGHGELARQSLRAAEATMGEATPAALVELLRETTNRIRFDKAQPGIAVALSERELAVLRLLPHGLTRREMGDQLFVSENTIKTYLTSIRHKLGVTGRSAQIVNRAIELGLLERPS